MNTPKLTKEQAAIIGLYTGIACGPFSDIHELAEKLAGHPIFTHQLPAMKEQLKELVRPHLIAICHGDNK